MPAVHDGVEPIEAFHEIALIGIELECVRHDAIRIRQHAVFGNDRKTFDTPGKRGHARGSP
jgi:hypothetical protein